MASASASAPRGRPRDPTIEDRVLDCAALLYSQTGWHGFSFDAIARESGVGKAAIYRRWPDRAHLLTHMLQSRSLYFEDIDTGSTRDDLAAMADLYISHLTGPYGTMLYQVLIDTLHYPEVREAAGGYHRTLIRAGRRIGRRALERHDVPSAAAATLMIDLVIGSIQNHIVTTPPRLRTRMRNQLPDFRDRLITAVLAGVETLH